MTELREVQSAVMRALCEGDPAAEAYLSRHADCSPATQLAIYRGSMIANLSTALADIFPACRVLMGPAFFDELARRYVRQFPSTSVSLDDYGEQMPEFIRQAPPLAAYPFLVDVSVLEWHWHRAFHAADEGPFPASDLARVPAERHPDLIFGPARSLTLLPLVWKITQVWRAARDDAHAPEVLPGPEWVVIARQGPDVTVTTVDEAEFVFLSSLKTPMPFGTFCERWLSKLPDVDPGPMLLAAIQRGWINRFSL